MKSRPPRRRIHALERAVIVTRVSTESQSDNTSHESQLKACRDLCARMKLLIVDELEEVESGALYHSRDETNQAVEMVENDLADVVVFFDVTRYGRDVEFQHKFLKRIVKAGGQLQFAMFQLSYDEYGYLTPESEQMLNHLGGSSASEKTYIRRRLTNGKKAKTAEGLQVYRTLNPLGWKIADKNSVIRGEFPTALVGYYFPVPAELKIVREEIFDPYSKGKSLRDLARDLTAKGIPTPKGNAAWWASTIRYILMNPVYIGRPASGRTESVIDDERKRAGLDKSFVRMLDASEWKHLDTEKIKAHFARPDIAPHLIPEDVYVECQRRLATNQAERSGRKDRKYVLTGMLLCPACGKRMMGRARRRPIPISNRKRPEPKFLSEISDSVFVYICSGRGGDYSTSERRCNTVAWNAVILERLVREAFLHCISHPDNLGAAMREFTARGTVKSPPIKKDSLEKQLGDIQKRQEIMVRKQVEAEIKGLDGSPYDAALASLSKEKRDLLEQIKDLGSAPKKIPVALPCSPDEFHAVFNAVDVPNDKKNTLLRTMIETATVIRPDPKSAYQGRAAGVILRLKSTSHHHALVTAKEVGKSITFSAEIALSDA